MRRRTHGLVSVSFAVLMRSGTQAGACGRQTKTHDGKC